MATSSPVIRRGSCLVQRIRNSHHIGATHEANFGFKSCTSKLLFLVWFSNLKFLQRACHPWDRNFKLTTLGSGATPIVDWVIDDRRLDDAVPREAARRH